MSDQTVGKIELPCPECARKDAEIAELQKDRERLDWIEAHPASSEPASDWSVMKQRWVWRYLGRWFDTLRQAIDAAMKH